MSISKSNLVLKQGALHGSLQYSSIAEIREIFAFLELLITKNLGWLNKGLEAKKKNQHNGK